ncbi:MAG: hypothetical protein R3B45_12780 [Bdellovibrionota bacterium]
MKPSFFDEFLAKNPHPQADVLIRILSSKTGLSTTGYPFIEESAFGSFLQKVPHLFSNGLNLLHWLEKLSGSLENERTDEVESFLRAIKVVKTVILTAVITAPTDLWLLRQILSTLKKAGVLEQLLSGDVLVLKEYAAKAAMSYKQLQADFAFLHSRGYLQKELSRGSHKQDSDVFSMAKTTVAQSVLTAIQVLSDDDLKASWFHQFRDLFSGNVTEENRGKIASVLEFTANPTSFEGWCASWYEIELGFRIVPIVLALRSLQRTPLYKRGLNMQSIDLQSKNLPMVLPILQLAGYVDHSGNITSLGERVFQRGPGPFGIIYTYHAYMKHHEDLLYNREVSSWVSRGENVAASQDANRKTFAMANDALDRFCAKYHYHYNLYIEHAVGQGEATRQRLERSGEDQIQYFGADLEDAAIDRAIGLQKDGALPKNMKFIRSADIGQPDLLIRAILDQGYKTEGSIMIVGNGFHEVRQQTNEKMIGVLKAYCEAGIILLFTEESGLLDEDLLSTGWNTYHAGFRYVHAISGQGLRPAIDKEDSPVYSWAKCARLGGYEVLNEFCTRTRTIYPHPRKDGYNPAISVNYFCVPGKISEMLRA